MTLNDLQNALSFLSRVYVGRGDEERLMKTISALTKEINKKVKIPVTTGQ
jgi:hypothetical protein|tara:strand:+ start:932 stop:1081 length:150 start_codon:yes stop_codon:yes gene_type:complete